MAHSYIQAFGDDEAAFRAFAADAPVPPTFLVDTYDVDDGVRAAVRVITDLGLDRVAAVRIDSGDLAAGARRVRALLDQSGLPTVRIVASGGLDEFAIHRLIEADAPIDVFAVGTALGVSDDAPSLDSSYKLVEYAGVPVLKLSAGKAMWPGAKHLWRRTEPGTPLDDRLALRGEAPPPRRRAVLSSVMRNGRRLAPRGDVPSARRRLLEDLARLPSSARAIQGPVAPRCDYSAELRATARRLGRRDVAAP